MYNVKHKGFYFEEIMPYLNDRIDFAFLEKVPSGDGLSVEQAQSFFIFLNDAIRNDLFVYNNKCTYLLLKTNMTDKIINASWTIKDSLFELISKEDKFSFGKEETINCVNFLLILKDILQAYSSIDIYDFNEYGNHKKDFYQHLNNNLFKIVDIFSDNLLSLISPIIHVMAVKSFFPYYEDDQSVAVLSRLVAVFSHLSKMLSLYQLDDNGMIKGSKTSYGSMITSLQNNAAFFALDKNIISELKTFSSII